MNKKKPQITLETMDAPSPRLERYLGGVNPYTDSQIEEIGLNFLAYVIDNEDVILITEVAPAMHLSNETIFKWGKDNKSFKACLSQARLIIANRREKGGLTNKLNASMVQNSMPIYSDTWKSLEEWRNSMRIKIEDAKTKSALAPVVITKYETQPGYVQITEEEYKRLKGKK